MEVPFALTRQEVAYLRSELLPRFGVQPRVADGIILRSWKSGPLSRTPRLPAAVKTMVDRGLLDVRQRDPAQPFRAFWTETGLRALFNAFNNGRSFDPDLFGHIILELKAQPFLADSPPRTL